MGASDTTDTKRRSAYDFQFPRTSRYPLINSASYGVRPPKIFCILGFRARLGFWVS